MSFINNFNAACALSLLFVGFGGGVLGFGGFVFLNLVKFPSLLSIHCLEYLTV